ncbi:siderophore-interacting protein [Hydrogenophaga sp. BPS33]|uniref:siderophore-interacting protein n=1 Tax=Hydrogenophaga sp. BPS33 TaxID=2651974 RepID=UPI00131FD1FF|nr:siderophore-interacting protein [Hydrogenophaga sp. BPS33]QHE87048.1 siderophore-interacting protein [Hydrogenophaga sp. BPS33]
MNTSTHPTLAVERVRHEIKVRRLQVQRFDRISPHFVRIRFASDALRDFISASFDDHAKLMLPAQPGQPLVLPQPGPDGLALPPGAQKSMMRDYTPRQFDPAAGTLDIEFVLHGEGVASLWAEAAQTGDEVGLGGPRGSFVVPTGFDWHLLVGDESAIPAIARRLEELPETAQAITVIETADAADRRDFTSRATLQAHWVDTGATDALAKVVAGLKLPTGEGFAWAGGEAASMVAVRQALVNPDGHGLDKSRVRASAYWKRGSVGHHETLGG